MAATVSAWGKPGAWALESEESDGDLTRLDQEDSSLANEKSDEGETADFPSLSAAVTAKTKKKKGQTLSLQQFSNYSVGKPGAGEAKGLTPDELMMLPTGPRQRSAEELDRNKLGGGFRSYGGGARDDQQRRSFNRESSREFAPSRADETDDWGAKKKFTSSVGFDRKERAERGGFFSDSQSRADDVDNWASQKNFLPSDSRKSERKPGFGFDSGNGGADSTSWVKPKEEDGRKIGGAFDSLRDRKGGFEPSRVDSESWGRKKEEEGFSTRPKLNLQPRTRPVTEDHNVETVDAAKPKASSPFGEARPREEVLKEKGQDWKDIDKKLESLKTKEVVSSGTNNGSSLRMGFRGGNGGERRLQEEKTDRPWRRLESDGSSPKRDDETKSRTAEKRETGEEVLEGGDTPRYDGEDDT